MSNTAICVENLSKSYRLGTIGTGTFYGDLKRWWAMQRGMPDPYLKIGETDHGNRKGETVWALENVNFTVQQGEAVGIIGRNGAGKSTLLKILSQVTAPTDGAVKVKGRIASLLEVGTGFHPDLTGRENIFMNAALLGMTRAEVIRKFDEIVDFSGVEQFIDTPVKRYSSGMYVRLAFAVAAHLEPDILVVDEVLAVGDAEFQKKSLGKMDEVAHKGRTILFVSHNMGMIHSLCNRAILLQRGNVLYDGDSSLAISHYYNNGVSTPYSMDYSKLEPPIGNKYVTLLSANIEGEGGQPTGEVDINTGFRVRMKYKLHGAPPQSPYPNFHFYNSNGQCVFVTAGDRLEHISGDAIYEAVCNIPANFLNNDTYFIGIAVVFTHDGIQPSFFEQGALSIIVRDPMDIDNVRQGYAGSIPGVIRPKLNWDVRIIS